MRIKEVKKKIAESLGIPVEEQRLLLFGKTLADELTINSYPSIKEGTKLNLIIKKPDGLYEVGIKYFKSLGRSDAEAIKASANLMKIVERKFNELSWDDVERLAKSCLEDEARERKNKMK